MKASRRRLVALGITALATLGAVGCSDDSNRGGEQQSPAKGSGTLTFLDYQEAPEALLRAFTKETGIRVKFEQIPSDQYPSVLQTRVRSKADIDLLGVRGGPEFNRFARTGAFADLTGSRFLTNYLPAAVQAGTSRGKVYGASRGAYAVGTYYNRELFERAGVKPPTTWDELLEACERLKAKDIAPIVVGAGEGWTTQYFYHAALAQDVAERPTLMQDLKEGRARWSDARHWRTQVERFQELAERDFFLEGSRSLKYDEALEAFTSGKAAMWVMGNFSLQGIEPDFAEFPVGVFPLPFNDAGGPAPASLLTDSIITIPEWSDQQAEARRFYEFISRRDSAALNQRDTGNVSAIKGVPTDYHTLADEWAPLYERANPYPLDMGPSVNGEGPNLLQGVLAGRASPDEVVDGFQKLQKTDNRTGY